MNIVSILDTVASIAMFVFGMYIIYQIFDTIIHH